MRKYKCIAVLILALAACNKVAPEQDTVNGLQEMSFEVKTGTVTKGGGIYNSIIYPTNRIYLTAFYNDGYSKEGQYYFQNMPISANYLGIWVATGWYWPIQGQMSFISYYCPTYSQDPAFDIISNSEGGSDARMTVNPSSALDGKTDFLYLAHTVVDCPKTAPITLTFDHGLSWIVVTVQAKVMNAAGTDVDPILTAEVIDRVKINKVVLEDCSRKGTANIVSGKDITWTIDPANIKDQIYFKPSESSLGMNEYDWQQVADGNKDNISTNFSISATQSTLGEYSPDADCLGAGLLIVPQRKTAITVYYNVTVDNGGEPQTFNKVERFELRDNEEQWRPGLRYQYDIIFKNHSETASSADLVETWTYVNPNDNICYGEGAYAGGFVINHIHDGGSGLGNDMDYYNGGTYH